MRLILLSFSFLFIASMANAKTVHVVIDAGHGGPSEWGYTGTGFDEKTIDLILAKKIQTILETEDKYEVVLTRIGDYPITLNDRRKTANQYEDSVFVSIHSSTYDKEPHVISYVLKQVTGNQNPVLMPIEYVHGHEYKNSMKFAQILQEEFPENMNHQIIMPKFPLANLVGIQSPAILTECQCVSSNQQSTDANLDEFSRNMAEGIESFIRKVL
jgi:N-acetylmuramoyl-L-alanine amidase